MLYSKIFKLKIKYLNLIIIEEYIFSYIFTLQVKMMYILGQIPLRVL